MRYISPFAFVIPFGFVALVWASPSPDVDGNRDLMVTPEAGKWMICAASYSGPESADLARQLAEQLRTRDKLPAYTYSRSNVERQKQAEENERLKQMYPGVPMRRRTVRIEDQWV